MKRFYELCALCMICMFIDSGDAEAADNNPIKALQASKLLEAGALLYRFADSLDTPQIKNLTPDQLALLFETAGKLYPSPTPFILSKKQIHELNEQQLTAIKGCYRHSVGFRTNLSREQKEELHYMESKFGI
ncbi:hypothetical protein FACS189449_06660 [Alphaproteobacteria bacterium]|nr:hypothetical protein FACS189449_06660 [Alphaproteobacteria bacterium]